MESYQKKSYNSFVLLFIFICVLNLTACTANKSQPNENLAGILKSNIKCSEPRPQICTKEFRPVCGVKQDGSSKTYGTGCMACSDKLVNSYKNGTC